MSDIFQKYGLTRVINTRGPATVLGASTVPDEIREEVSQILGSSVEMWELQRCASQWISELTGAPAGCVTGCTSAGIAVCCAAALTGTNPAKIKSLPNLKQGPRKIVIQKGQVTGAGDAPVYQVVQMTGAQYEEIGEALDCATFHLEDALDENTAAALYVMEDTFAPNLLSIEQFVEICHAKGVPVIVDAAYLTDFKKLWNLKVDLAIYSVQKWLSGPTAGIIAGREDLVTACYMQEMGVGRPMKCGKEGVMGCIAAIKRWLSLDWQAIHHRQMHLADLIIKPLEKVNGLTLYTERSDYSPAVRVRMKVDPAVCSQDAYQINTAIGKGNPVIKTDDYFVNVGDIIFDLSYVDEDDARSIANAVLNCISDAGEEARTVKPTHQTRQDLLYNTMRLWLRGNPREVE